MLKHIQSKLVMSKSSCLSRSGMPKCIMSKSATLSSVSCLVCHPVKVLSIQHFISSASYSVLSVFLQVITYFNIYYKELLPTFVKSVGPGLYDET